MTGEGPPTLEPVLEPELDSVLVAVGAVLLELVVTGTVPPVVVGTPVEHGFVGLAVTHAQRELAAFSTPPRSVQEAITQFRADAWITED